MNPVTQKARQHLAELALGLTALEEWLDANPDLEVTAAYTPGVFYVFPADAEAFAEVVRRLAHGAAKGTVEKSVVGSWANATRTFGGAVTLQAAINREVVCERVQVGTQVVVAPNPAAVEALPKERREEPIYEWRCHPFLAHTHPAEEA